MKPCQSLLESCIIKSIMCNDTIMIDTLMLLVDVNFIITYEHLEHINDPTAINAINKYLTKYSVATSTSIMSIIFHTPLTLAIALEHQSCVTILLKPHDTVVTKTMSAMIVKYNNNVSIYKLGKHLTCKILSYLYNQANVNYTIHQHSMPYHKSPLWWSVCTNNICIIKSILHCKPTMNNELDYAYSVGNVDIINLIIHHVSS